MKQLSKHPQYSQLGNRNVFFSTR